MSDTTESPPIEDVQFFEPPKKGRKKAEPKPKAPSNPMVDALKFAGIPLKKKGQLQESHVMLVEGVAVAHNGAITVGHPVDFPVSALAHHSQLLESVLRAPGAISVTHSTTGLSIVAEGVRMVVDCGDRHAWNAPYPDPEIAQASNALRDALAKAATYADDLSDRPTISGVLCQAFTAIGTNGHAIVEAWHGIDMPPNLRLPVAFVKAIHKTKLAIRGFGFSDKSFTVWFENNAWIRTAHYQGDYPSIGHLFDKDPGELCDLNDSFYKAVKTIVNFSETGAVYFVDGKICSKLNSDEASTYRLPGLPNLGFNGKYLLQAEKLAKVVRFTTDEPRMNFEGDALRGIIMGLETKQPVKLAPKSEAYVDADGNAWEDDIPY